MCGIVGYVGPKVAAPMLIEGLKRLEYRGYDSAGVSTLNAKQALSFVRQRHGLPRAQQGDRDRVLVDIQPDKRASVPHRPAPFFVCGSGTARS